MLSINIQNDGTGTDDSANYTFDVLVNGRKVDGGAITGHDRKDDWKTLLSRLIAQNTRYFSICEFCGIEISTDSRETALRRMSWHITGDHEKYGKNIITVIERDYPFKKMTQEEWDALHDETFFEIMENTK